MIRALALSALIAHPAMAACTADTMIVFDASASMTAQSFDGRHGLRIDEARAAMARVMPQVEDLRRIGLVTYGRDADCNGSRLRFAPQPRAAARMAAELDALRPGGLTPLTNAVALAAAALSWRSDPAVIVLVTDGNESCGGAPCALIEQMAPDSADLTIHVLGFKVESDPFSALLNRRTPEDGAEIAARCLADRTGGVYATTDTVDELADALQATLGCPVIGGLHPAPSARIPAL
ncbi:vWA domain-containing protein [Jannaschia seohaensis]|uniref:Ca-activated chloride channel family protein n=1 Tax=Jannaschia seohaensis TaxID=475081 RepID=A0A2Y9AXJ1_9RHOB|nr:vWA domain-containing protein [Jannaschia seohaensis]PWJ18254.1 Ca-activated chloride channel family protein [Jannaschia seohaensis]SSA46779.1 Ca-activated chloride channel family protein [Jannaschia seohaensis]